MEITQVKIFPVHEDKLKAFVSIVFDHCFMVNDIKVIQGKDGLFLSMPSRRKKSGEFKDVAHPLNNETRRLLEERVLREYRLEVDDPTPRRPDREEANAGGEAPRGARSADGSPAGRDAGDRKAAERESGDPRSGDRDAADRKSGDPPAPVADVVSQVAASEKSLEEVQEMHLSDSFWSVS